MAEIRMGKTALVFVETITAFQLAPTLSNRLDQMAGSQISSFSKRLIKRFRKMRVYMQLYIGRGSGQNSIWNLLLSKGVTYRPCCLAKPEGVCQMVDRVTLSGNSGKLPQTRHRQRNHRLLMVYVLQGCLE